MRKDGRAAAPAAPLAGFGQEQPASRPAAGPGTAVPEGQHRHDGIAGLRHLRISALLGT